MHFVHKKKKKHLVWILTCMTCQTDSFSNSLEEKKTNKTTPLSEILTSKNQ